MLISLTPYQAELILTALLLLDAETETALFGATIMEDQKNNDDVLTVIQMAEDNKLLQAELSKKFNLSANK